MVETMESDETVGGVIEAEVTPVQKPAVNKKWGPVPAPRCSTRVDLGGKTMLERAQEYKKVVNLEVPKIKVCP